MRRIVIAMVAVVFLASFAFAQKKGGSPTDTVVSFYQALKQKHYVEGFRHSVYREAVTGLSEAELRDLEPDFARTFAAIPDKIEPRGEQVTGDNAVVFLKFEGVEQPEQVGLVRVGGEWLVGDSEALALVHSQGRAFFFNTRIIVNESEVFEMMERIIGAQIIYSRRFEGRNASLEDLIRLGGVPKDLEGGEAGGYKYTLTLSADKKTFSATAVPVAYGKTGRLSFYAELSGVRAEDLKGRPASARSPVYKIK
jgi:hypothetical protein